MFDSEIGKNKDKAAMPDGYGRRAFLVTAGSALAGMILWSLRRPGSAQAKASSKAPQYVSIVEFSDAGERLKTEKVLKIVKTEDEWRKQLPRSAFYITRHADTEIAYSGEYWNLHEKGIYRCVCCGSATFSSETKFDSGTGWPSFGHRLRPRIFSPRKTAASAWSGRRFPALSATRIWATYSTTVQRLLICAFA